MLVSISKELEDEFKCSVMASLDLVLLREASLTSAGARFQGIEGRETFES